MRLAFLAAVGEYGAISTKLKIAWLAVIEVDVFTQGRVFVYMNCMCVVARVYV